VVAVAVEGAVAVEEAVHSAVVAEEAHGARAGWVEAEDAVADTAGLRSQGEATVAEEVEGEPGPRSGPVAAAATGLVGWPRTGM
jgi:hypothetical protein